MPLTKNWKKNPQILWLKTKSNLLTASDTIKGWFSQQQCLVVFLQEEEGGNFNLQLLMNIKKEEEKKSPYSFITLPQHVNNSAA